MKIAVFLTGLSLLQASHGVDPAAETRLLDDLLAKYNPLAKAYQAGNETLLVKMNIDIIRVIDWDKSVLTLSAKVIIIWNDDRLKWDYEQYGEVHNVRIPPSKIWHPDIRLFNDAGSDNLFLADIPALIFPHGMIVIVRPVTLRTTCANNDNDDDDDDDDDDEHRLGKASSHGGDKTGKRKGNSDKNTFLCKLDFGSWSYSGSELDMNITSVNAPLDNYKDLNKEWKVTRVEAVRKEHVYPCCNEVYVSLNYNIRIKPKF